MEYSDYQVFSHTEYSDYQVFSHMEYSDYQVPLFTHTEYSDYQIVPHNDDQVFNRVQRLYGSKVTTKSSNTVHIMKNEEKKLGHSTVRKET